VFSAFVSYLFSVRVCALALRIVALLS
jgi:hypothetical protein